MTLKKEDRTFTTSPRKAFVSFQFYESKKEWCPMIDITQNYTDSPQLFSVTQASFLAMQAAEDIKGTQAEYFVKAFCESMAKYLSTKK